MPGLNFFRMGTLLVPSGPTDNPDGMHLHVICTDPDPAGRQILVSVSTFYDGDDTCILLPYQHKWLWKERSFVEYRWAAFRQHRDLVTGVEQKKFIPKVDINSQDFLRVCKGIEKSPLTPTYIKDAYRTCKAIRHQVEYQEEADDEPTNQGQHSFLPGR